MRTQHDSAETGLVDASQLLVMGEESMLSRTFGWMGHAGLLSLVVAAVSGCGGQSGGGGSQESATGKNSVVTALQLTAPAAQCPAGGATIESGIDVNANGILDASEVSSTQYVCNGASGASALVAVDPEAAGSNCANGGSKVSVGTDTNSSGTLEPGEVTSTSYICSGTSVAWQRVENISVQAVSNIGYLADNADEVTVTLPTNPVLGDRVAVSGVGAGGWKLAQNGTQSIVTKNIPSSIGANWVARESTRNWYTVASSADGAKLVAADTQGKLYTSVDSGLTWTPRDSNRNWVSVASSSDGTKLVAADSGGQLFTSTDSGVSWTARDSVRNWYSVASSSDGTKLVAADATGQLYTSVDSGVNWTPRESVRSWEAVASSADGTKLIAVAIGSAIYTSTDSGVSWTPRETSRNWYCVTSSVDGKRLVAGVDGGQLYKSSDYGVTWTAVESNRSWRSVASSADGMRLVAAAAAGQIYYSPDAGVNWNARDSNRNWYSVASSADGTRFVAVAYGDQILTSDARTTVGTSGSIAGKQYDAIEVQYIGGNVFSVLSHEGDLSVQ